MLAQIFQSTACNAIHSIEQRTAKWIISAMERTDDADAVPLTHEQLATMLGVGRSYVSRVIQTFKAEGVLETRRGSILVLNREALRIRACLCNECVKNHFEEVLRGLYPTEEGPPRLKSVLPRRWVARIMRETFSGMPSVESDQE